MSGKITVYACGGTGINIASYFESMRGKPTQGFADINVVYIDTSAANLRGKSLDSNIYLINDGQKDGSGSIRNENLDDIRTSAPDILRMHKPTDLNIVLSSGSGGSGSVIAPVITSQLLADGHVVMPAMVGTTDNAKAIENTINTLKSYEGITRARKRPLTLMYYQNGGGQVRSAIDNGVRDDILRIAGLFSNLNLELDSADLRNWLNYDRVTDFEPKLMAFSSVRGKVQEGKSIIVSLVTLANSPDDVNHDMVFPYSKTGFVDPANVATMKISDPIHFLVLDGVINAIYQDLDHKKSAVQDDSRNRVRTVGSIVDKGDAISGDGLVI